MTSNPHYIHGCGPILALVPSIIFVTLFKGCLFTFGVWIWIFKMFTFLSSGYFY